MSAFLNALHHECAVALLALERTFGPNYELTLIGRNKSNPKAHVLVSSEVDPLAKSNPIEDVLAELRKRHSVTPVKPLTSLSPQDGQ